MVMNRDALNQLTQTQKICLRAVILHHTSKDIARQLGISPHTVDNHIKAAMARLGAASRIDAARLLNEFEGHQTSRALASQGPVLSEHQTFPTYSSHDDSKGTDGNKILSEVREIREQFVSEDREISRHFKLPLPTYWGERNDLSLSQKLAWVLALIMIICLSIGAITASIKALQDIV
jgi:DNA-binding CsgD family transcriptional regulator